MQKCQQDLVRSSTRHMKDMAISLINMQLLYNMKKQTYQSR